MSKGRGKGRGRLPSGRQQCKTTTPIYGAWPEKRGTDVRRKKSRNSQTIKRLSNFDFKNWCEYLNIPIKDIFSRNQAMKSDHSPCIINMDNYVSQGTHWVGCIMTKPRNLKLSILTHLVFLLQTNRTRTLDSKASRLS